MNILDQIHNHTYPNALAKLKVSIKDMSIENIGFTQEGLDMASKKNSKTTSKSNNSEVNLIWKNLELGNINISYACVGYALDGRPILLQDELISLLINYGFSLKAVMAFIDDFSKQTKKDTKAPIIMYSANTAKIMTEIKPIVGNK